MPFIYESGALLINRIFRPVNRHFVLDRGGASLSALIWAYQMTMTDGQNTYNYSSSWASARLRDGTWSPGFELLAAKDMPRPGGRWINDVPFFQRDQSGAAHLLLQSCVSGLWSSQCDMFYLAERENGWSGPLELGSTSPENELRSLAQSANGAVFAAWVNNERHLVGRWLLPSRH
jgi:hypothetical protein